MLQGAVAAVDAGEVPPRPKPTPIGSSWLEWATYCTWHRSFYFCESGGRVRLTMIGSSEPGSSPIVSTVMRSDFDIGDARLLRDRLDEAIQAAESS